LAFLALVTLTAGVGIVSYLVQSRIGEDVAELRPNRGADLQNVDLENTHLEIEGFHDATGAFVATDVHVSPGIRRPKLRAAIEALDPAARTLSLYGVEIAVTPSTSFLGSEASNEGFEDLRRGQRIEVSATLDEGRWSARKIRTQDVKPSDQIKGTPTGEELDGRGLETIEFGDIRVAVSPRRGSSPQGALRQIELARRLSLQLQEALVLARELVEGRGAGSGSRAGTSSASGPELGENLRHAEEEFEQTLARCLEGFASGTGSSRLETLLERMPVYREYVDRLQTLAGRDAAAARRFLGEVFDPFVNEQLLPLVYAHQSLAEEQLARQVRGISERARTTTRVAFASSALAVVLAASLGYLTWRSIQVPLVSLHQAAVRIGQGDLGTRVSVESRDELGVLAAAFNRMAEDLARTTVSVQELEHALRDRELLLHEVHHRVKNNMQVISSLLAIQASEVKDPIAREKFEECQGRIRSMALIHEQLHRTADISSLDLRAYLQRLGSHVLESFGEGVRLEVDVAGVELGLDQALACGLIVNELLTNSLKHGKAGGGVSEVRVELAEDGSGRLVLSVRDDGPGFPEGEWRHSGGIGFDLVATLVKQLDGELEVGWSGGGVVRVVFDGKQASRESA